MMHVKNCLLVSVFFLIIFAPVSVLSSDSSDTPEVRGRYLVEIGGCNDCHTAGFAPNGGNIPEDQWLQGDTLGYRGPWGTTYAINLRQYFSDINEDAWVEKAKSLRTKPPMPWWALNAMTEDDLRAVYRYTRSLGSSDSKVPAYLPPAEEPKTPYIQWPSPPENQTESR